MLDIFILVFSYFLGSVPFGVVVARFTGQGDLRQTGSGNIGATNVLRTTGPVPALVTLALDMAKGALPVLIGGAVGGEWLAAAAGLLAVAGHCYPAHRGFKGGGKGVAAAAGVALAASPPSFLCALAVFALAVALSKRASVGSLSATVLLPFFFLEFTGPGPFSLFSLPMAVIIVIRHRENITRLLEGKEPRTIGKPKDPTN